MKVIDPVTVTVYGQTLRGRYMYGTGDGLVWVRLDEPTVIDGPGWHQTVPEGTPLESIQVPREWVTVA